MFSSLNHLSHNNPLARFPARLTPVRLAPRGKSLKNRYIALYIKFFPPWGEKQRGVCFCTRKNKGRSVIIKCVCFVLKYIDKKLNWFFSLFCPKNGLHDTKRYPPLYEVERGLGVSTGRFTFSGVHFNLLIIAFIALK